MNALKLFFNDNWILDLTEYIGYKVKVDDEGNVIDYACVHWYDDFGRCVCCGNVKYGSYAYRELYGGE